MKYFYLFLLILSTSAFTADLILRYMEKIKSFDFNGRLFESLKSKSKTIPLDKFFPESLTMLLLAVMAASATGSLYTIAGLDWYFSLPCALAGGMLICFAVQETLRRISDSFMQNNLPKGDEAAGLDGYCVEPFEPGEWGKVRLFHKEREFEVNAVHALESPPDTEKTKKTEKIEEGEKVISVYESDGFYFVVRVDRIFRDIKP
ncbi:MAG: hypothetical protein FWG83_05060 [Oscillospiraceae bacterium]|nr:hypothetical protein [Oscillospiraceae bacterium]